MAAAAGDAMAAWVLSCSTRTFFALTADYGVLPVENSSTGIITDVYDLMHLYDNYIVGEYVVKV